MTIITSWYRKEPRSMGQIYAEKWRQKATSRQSQEVVGPVSANEAFMPVGNYFRSDYSFYEGNRNLLTNTDRIDPRMRDMILSIASRKGTVTAITKDGERFRLTAH